MVDKDGPDIAKDFYGHMFHGGSDKADFRDSAEALDVAIQVMEKKGISIDQRINFIHIGA
jgi:hypothetical protein